jgi:hypothetical protein
MYILPQNVDLLKKHDIFLHNTRVLLFVHILILLEHLSQIIYVIFEVLAFVGILSVQIGISLFILDLFLDVLFVEADNALFEFLEVGDMMETFKNVILKLLLETLLIIELLSQMGNLIGQTFLSHS